ncbi:histidinol dehydrogenase [Shewanella schlegeliana]|uniref:Histidinol dehydrogenase n=1 Tax=Shewanella schlegeliana TaxID=190308 RepID=A0ABS1SWG4_9GAMM|nr:histidinol dehydrogenase [Shewanella schlegeliana]MBL4911927.1 histidinol dehydrogenase [Shewanella schlegeliana]MCL1110120.1 histidinol dehydrogenase [Shewanella schlegeliana]GIU26840.1 histidinol dehydrogenase [Shewanella schlegeliana]
MQILNWQSLSPQAQLMALKRSPLIGDSTLEQSVARIIEAVVANGDNALRDFNREFDGISLETLKLTATEIEQSCQQLPDELKQAIAQAKANIERFHHAQLQPKVDIETQAGIRCELRCEPIERVGLYIPGGTAPLISTVLMLALPAKIAGCAKRVLVSPPPINDAIIYAANACGIDEIYQVGGAQAIAALAFGTESVPQVDKIFGPGNRFVTEAKRAVSQDNRCTVSIDMPAGPSEVLIIADAQANPEFIAADLLSQAEHGADSQVMLVTDSSELGDAVNRALATQLKQLPRSEIATIALESSRTLIVEDLQMAAKVSNLYGPEHLIIQTENPRAVLNDIRAAGSVFLGAYTPESVGDYASGTNHVLPTYGYSKTVSSLSLADFSRRFTVQELTAQGLETIADSVMILAAAEQLEAHKNAVAVRLASLNEGNVSTDDTNEERL